MAPTSRGRDENFISKLTSCSRLSERRIASSRLELREELSCPGDVAAWNKLPAGQHVKFLKRVERKNEISAREKILSRSCPPFFFASHRSVSQRKRGQPMNHEELRDKNYAAIKHDINASCMRARDFVPASHVIVEMKISLVWETTAGNKRALLNVRVKCRKSRTNL